MLKVCVYTTMTTLAVMLSSSIGQAQETMRQSYENLTITGRVAVQGRLHDLGLYSGQPDGVWGANTDRALRAYQEQHFSSHSFLGFDGYMPPEVWDYAALFSLIYQVETVAYVQGEGCAQEECAD